MKLQSRLCERFSNESSLESSLKLLRDRLKVLSRGIFFFMKGFSYFKLKSFFVFKLCYTRTANILEYFLLKNFQLLVSQNACLSFSRFFNCEE